VAGDNSVRITFGELKKGMHARVIGCTDCSAEVLRLQEMGLTEGATFEVIKVAPFGDPVEIDLRGYRLCLRKKENCAFILECQAAGSSKAFATSKSTTVESEVKRKASPEPEEQSQDDPVKVV
jgi:ferrous iron transport protein A